MTKYIELTGYGNNRKHLVPIKAIVDICFEDPKYTSIKLITGATINVIEEEMTIIDLLSFHGVIIANLDVLESMKNNHPFDDYEYDDSLPF
jgi:hypothetical protein